MLQSQQAHSSQQSEQSEQLEQLFSGKHWPTDVLYVGD